MLRATIPFGHIAGIRVGAHWSALVTLGLFTWLLGHSLTETSDSTAVWLVAAAGAFGLFASLVAHELAHSIVARRNGVRVERVVIWLLGGLSELEDEPKDPRADLRIALAGPLTNIAVAAAGFVVAVAVGDSAGEPVLHTLVWLSSMNLILAVFNLLPGAPLDGGRVLRAMIWRTTGDRLHAATVAARSGRILSLTLLVLGGLELILLGDGSGIWLMLLGWFLYSAANAELANAGLRHRLGDIRVREVMSDPVSVPVTWSVGRLLVSDVVRSEHHVFPVVDGAGRPVGVLSWSDLTGLPVSGRSTTLLRSVARPLPHGAVAMQDELLSDAVSRVVLRPDLDLIAAVDPLGRLTGVVTTTDLALACHRSALGLSIRPPRRPPHRNSDNGLRPAAHTTGSPHDDRRDSEVYENR